LISSTIVCVRIRDYVLLTLFTLPSLPPSFLSRSLTLSLFPFLAQVSNEEEVMSALKALEDREYRHGGTVIFRDVDYNVLTFKEQITIDLGGWVQSPWSGESYEID
jgi:hypothetical protein